MRILLVDDEPALRELLRATFEGADVTVDEAASGAEAEARIVKHRPDVVVLDLRMPGMSGAELCSRLKADGRTKDIPIVLLTGADAEEARRAQRAGASALVRKPFSPLDLLAVVERVSGRTPVPRKPRRAKPADEELVLYARDLRHLLEIERGQRELLQESYLATVTSLASALESRDTRTGAHSQRVQRYAVELLDTIDPGRLERDPGVQYGFLLHDIGKIAIPDEILQKPGPLTRGERRRMQTHTVLGEQMLGGVAILHGEGLRVVRSHHERWDGRGYPDGLRRSEVPLAARIFAVADALDAMTSDRPYRKALKWDAARSEIVAQSGKQFDPEVVEAYVEREAALRETQRELAAPELALRLPRVPASPPSDSRRCRAFDPSLTVPSRGLARVWPRAFGSVGRRLVRHRHLLPADDLASLDDEEGCRFLADAGAAVLRSRGEDEGRGRAVAADADGDDPAGAGKRIVERDREPVRGQPHVDARLQHPRVRGEEARGTLVVVRVQCAAPRACDRSG